MYINTTPIQMREGYTLGKKLREAAITGITPDLALNGQCDTDDDDFVCEDGTPDVDPHGNPRFEISECSSWDVGRLKKFMSVNRHAPVSTPEPLSENPSQPTTLGSEASE